MFSVIVHFGAAGDHMAEVGYMGHFLNELRDHSNALRQYGPMFLQLRVPQVPPKAEMYIRAQRIATMVALEHNTESELEYLTTILPLLQEEDADVAMLTFAVLTATKMRIPFAIEAELLRRGLKVRLQEPLEQPIEHMLISLAYRINSAEDAALFMDVAAECDSSTISGALALKDGGVAIEAFNSYWLREADKLPVDQDWQAVLLTTDELLAGAERLRQPRLTALAARIKAIIVGEYLNDSVRSVAELDLLLSSQDLTLEDRWLLEETAAKQLIYGGRKEDGLRRLRHAMQHAPESEFARELFYSHLDIVRLLAPEDHTDALDHLNAAEHLTMGLLFSDHDRFRVLAEKAIVIWRNVGLDAAWKSFGAAAIVLYQAEVTDLIKSDVVQFGHAIGYVVEARVDTPSDESLYLNTLVAPFPGMFGTPFAPRVPHYNELRRAFTARQLMLFAGLMGDEKAEGFWAAVFEPSLTNPETRILRSLTDFGLVRRDMVRLDVARALDRMDESNTLLAANLSAREAGEIPTPDSPIDLESWRLRLNPEYQEGAQSTTYRFFCIYLGYTLALHKVRGKNFMAEAALEIRKACDLLAPSIEHGNKFLSLIELLDISSDAPGWQTIYRFAMERSKANPDLACTAYLLACVQDDIASDQAYQLQNLIMEYVEGTFRTLDRGAMPLLVAKFLQEYWVEAIERRSFQFQVPRLVGGWLQEAACSHPATSRPAKILDAIRVALGLSF
jgi:hypothetical protein